MTDNISTITWTTGLSFRVRALTLSEISSTIRQFRNLIGPIAAQTMGLVNGERDRAIVQQTVESVHAVLDHLVGVAIIDGAHSEIVGALPLSVKIEALGAIVRRTLDAFPLFELQMVFATAAISAIASNSNALLLKPQRSDNAVN